MSGGSSGFNTGASRWGGGVQLGFDYMLPSRVVETSLEGHHAEYAQAVRARLLAGVDVMPQESVWAPKPGAVGRYRWLMMLPIRERVLLRALVMDLGDDVPIPDRSAEAFNTFQAAPLEVLAHQYIAVADVDRPRRWR